MKKSVSRLVVLVSLMVLALSVGSAMAGTMLSLTVTENSIFHSEFGGYYELSFTVDNGGYTDIREFAIGNDSAGDIWVDHEASNAPSALTKGLIADKDDSDHWRVWTYDKESNTGQYHYLTWLDGATGFDNFEKAFLYTSWGYFDSAYSGYLDQGFTNGYQGDTLVPASPFAAFSESGGTISGMTSNVPIPGALWLLGSGLLGLMAVRRKNG